jgi:hypothetical protein
LLAALTKWAKVHPVPDKFVIAFAGARALTAMELVEAVRDGRYEGELFVQMVAQGLEVTTLESILDGLTPIPTTLKNL